MKLQKPKNPNYCFNIVEVSEDIPLKGRDFIVHKNIFGNMVITSKGQFKKGCLAIYIPPGTQLSNDYCKYNNLFDKPENNIDSKKKGYISSKKRRIKAIRLGGFESNGLLMPIDSLNNIPSLSKIKIDFKLGDDFDTINKEVLCNKYIISKPINHNSGGVKKTKEHSKVIDNQFRFHIDTPNIYKNIWVLNPEDLFSVTEKIHGTSAISSKVLTKKNLTIFEKILKRLGVNIVDYTYDTNGLYASRRVIKNMANNQKDFYKDPIDWRRQIHEYLLPFMSNGMTIYYEIVGYTPNGSMIQKGFDYGCINPIDTGGDFVIGKHIGIYVYRITYTGLDGNVFEFSSKQVQNWCNQNSIQCVPEVFYGKLNEILPFDEGMCIDEWRNLLIQKMKEVYWHECDLCVNKVPNEGVVLRKENTNQLTVLKLKNFSFLQMESSSLDNDEINIEDSES